MNRIRLPLIGLVSLSASVAFAHPGHVQEVAGHSHWLTYGAAAAALLIGAGALVLAYKRMGRRSR